MIAHAGYIYTQEKATTTKLIFRCQIHTRKGNQSWSFDLFKKNNLSKLRSMSHKFINGRFSLPTRNTHTIMFQIQIVFQLFNFTIKSSYVPELLTNQQVQFFIQHYEHFLVMPPQNCQEPILSCKQFVDNVQHLLLLQMIVFQKIKKKLIVIKIFYYMNITI